MTAKVKQTKDNISIIIDKNILEKIDIKNEVEIEIRDNNLIIKPKPALEEILSKITPENLHKEIDFSQSGKELL
jgi:antitoxin component of MazEF toxin-antitoxin module